MTRKLLLLASVLLAVAVLSFGPGPKALGAVHPAIIRGQMRVGDVARSVKFLAAAPPAIGPKRGQLAGFAQLKATMNAGVRPGIAAMASKKKKKGGRIPVKYKGLKDSGFTPPDTHIAVGPRRNIEVVNSRFAIFDKRKRNRTRGGFVEFSDWVSFSNKLNGAAFFDPWIVYDASINRWIMLFLALRSADQKSWYVISVSAGPDPFTGFWQVMFLDASIDNDTPTNNWADYAKLGYDGDSVYITSNQFSFADNSFQYAKIRVLDKSDVVSNSVSGFTDFVDLKDADGRDASGIQPAVHYGANPAAFFINSHFSNSDELSIRTITGAPGSPVLSAPTAVNVGDYLLPPDARQKGSAALLFTGDARLLNASWRGGAIWTCHTVAAGGGAGARWYQVTDGTGGAPTVVQSGEFSGGGMDFFYPAILPTSTGGAGMVIDRSGPTEFASCYLTGRKAGDPLGTMQTPRRFGRGKSAYLLGRWGDYNGVSLDPVNPGRVYVGGQAAGKRGTWATFFAADTF